MSELKTHYKHMGIDYRDLGQTDHEYNNSTKCGFVRNEVTYNIDEVDCKLCWRVIKKLNERGG